MPIDVYCCPIVSLLVFGINTFAISQTTVIFKDDTAANRRYIGEFQNSLNQPYVTWSQIDFKEKLPEGKYIYTEQNRKDSAKKDFADYVTMEGQYNSDSLREGRFMYYSRIEKDKKRTSKLMRVYTYKNGLLNGLYFSNYSYGRHSEGYYKEGKRHGYFITYEPLGTVERVEFYAHDTLGHWIRFHKGFPLESGCGSKSALAGEYVSYDTLGTPKYKGYFENGNLKRLLYYDNGKLLEESIGEFKFCWEARHWIGTCGPPINGEVKRYNVNGDVVRMEIYKDGELVETKQY